MRPQELRALLDEVATGRLDPERATERLGAESVLDLGFARLDTQRARRQSEPEVVLAEGKRTEELVAIVEALAARVTTEPLIVTRCAGEAAEALRAAVPDLVHDPRARMLWRAGEPTEPRGLVTVVSAGTADGAVAAETVACARLLGAGVRLQEDVGVAGLHRLQLALEDLRAADCVVVAAGQDAALASVIGGLVETPVIAVPTSVGYGVATGGLTALASMLCSCAPAVAVVNIDDGLGAATVAARIARRAAG